MVLVTVPLITIGPLRGITDGDIVSRVTSRSCAAAGRTSGARASSCADHGRLVGQRRVRLGGGRPRRAAAATTTRGARRAATGRITAPTLSGRRQPPRGAGRGPTTLVSSCPKPPLRRLLIWRRPADRRRRARPDRPGHRRAGQPLRRRRATSSPWSAVRCATRCSAGCRTTSTSPPPRGPRRPSGCSRAGPTRSGTWAARSAPSARARATWQVEITTYRSETYDPSSRKPAVDFGDTLAGDLGRRDFTVNAMARLACRSGPSRTRTAASSTWRTRVLRTPGTPEDSFSDDPLRMMRAARFAAQLGFTVAPEVVAAMTDDGRADRRSSPPSGSATSWSSWSARRSPGAGLTLLVETGLAGVRAARAAGAGARARRAPPAQGRLRAHAHRARAVDRPRGPAAGGGPDFVSRFAALMHDVGKPRTRQVRRRRHRHLPPPRRGRRQADPQADAGAAVLQRRDRRGVAGWSSCTCASTATARGSGPTRRYAATSATPATSSSGCTS